MSEIVRIITATSIFDGHDAAINIFRRIMQDKGAEIIHLGHNRSAFEIVDAAIQENANAIAVTSYQGGHIEFFKYMYDLLKERNALNIKIFGGGGGVITPEEIVELENYGIAKIFSPEDGFKMGLEGMIDYLIEESKIPSFDINKFEFYLKHIEEHLPKALSVVEHLVNNEKWNYECDNLLNQCIVDAKKVTSDKKNIVLGITGVGGAGKSSLVDEFLRNFIQTMPDKRVGVLAIDPSKRNKGSLLGDRIRMNTLPHKNIYMRSMATRNSNTPLSKATQKVIELYKIANFDLIILETAGLGQTDVGPHGLADYNIYVMTPEYGAALQLEKINMIDYADIVVINKFDKLNAEDALYEVRKQYKRSHKLFDTPLDELPVYYTVASSFNNPSTNFFFRKVMAKIGFLEDTNEKPPHVALNYIIPPDRTNYLASIAKKVKEYHKQAHEDCLKASKLYELTQTKQYLHEQLKNNKELEAIIDMEIEKTNNAMSKNIIVELEKWSDTVKSYNQDELKVKIRDKYITYKLKNKTLSHTKVPRVSLPKLKNYGDILNFLYKENLPGYFPYTAGVFPFKRQDEKPTRMFAGEGTPERTNKRFHYLSKGQPYKRLSTAFDSITLYGSDPNISPDIFGKIGNSGVSIATIDDAKKCYSGFDLADAHTSVSMTINGPSPIMLAMFFNAAIDQQIEKYLKQTGDWKKTIEYVNKYYDKLGLKKPIYNPTFGLPINDNHLGLGLLGISGDQVVERSTYEKIKEDCLKQIRGTLQADILKEDQAQNTCLFSVEFALALMGDIQKYFTRHHINNFYSISISGYHMAEAGANPISQLAFTLANGFTYVEYFKSLGLDINDFSKNLSFFFSNGLDVEYSVIGRVARRIWAIALKYLYNADERGQKLKYHIQTSGRSLHSREMTFNDIRTTLQALTAIFDNCNSLHTNAYDEAITTPTEESVRQALAIQMIINEEFGMTKNDNPLQGSYTMEELTDIVEAAVLSEFENISKRGGVLGAMEYRYQRNKIQEESIYYESLKNSGELPIIGVNTFISEKLTYTEDIKLSRSTDEEKKWQLETLNNFKQRNQHISPTKLKELKDAVLKRDKIFEILMETVKYCSLGQITSAMFELGGMYRRSM